MGSFSEVGRQSREVCFASVSGHSELDRSGPKSVSRRHVMGSKVPPTPQPLQRDDQAGLPARSSADAPAQPLIVDTSRRAWPACRRRERGSIGSMAVSSPDLKAFLLATPFFG